MSKISRQDNKKRFKTGMYPTQQDFENLFDSYVHKDDTIDPSQVVSGNENIVQIINRKAEEKHSHEIADVEGLQTVLDSLRDDLDTAEDNIAGHETRIVTLEAAKTDYEAFKERVRAFLEDANASDTTIDRWHEIENFLQGITDTETLTGLLNNLKQEILAEIPEPQPQPTGNYLELVEDLDAYTDAPDGKIVKYVGQTNEKYTRGFDYERVAGTTYTFPVGSWLSQLTIPENEYGIKPGVYYYVGREDVDYNVWLMDEDSGAHVTYEDKYINENGDELRYGYGIVVCEHHPTYPDCKGVVLFMDFTGRELDEPFTITTSTWQPIPSFNVIN